MIENLKKKSSWGGKREGAGRPEGSKNSATLEKQIVEEELKRRILDGANNLLNSQMNLGLGVQMLYKIHTDKKGKRGRPELVTSKSEIEAFLIGDYDDEPNDYYFITTERPDNRAIDSMFDRVFGKALQHTDITSGGEKLESAIPPPIANKLTQLYEEEIKKELIKPKE